MVDSLIPPHGGYRKLKTFQLAQLVYDITVRFCERFVDRRSRTHDQMVQAARSGVQNIAEGSKASATSKKSELKLTNVARASLEELKLDYQDFLRHRKLPEWERPDPRRVELVRRRPASVDEFAQWVMDMHGHDGLYGHDGQSIESSMSMPSISSMEIAANGALVLIEIATALLARQLAAQARAFEREGGFTERLYRTRKAYR